MGLSELLPVSIGEHSELDEFIGSGRLGNGFGKIDEFVLVAIFELPDVGGADLLFAELIDKGS